MKVAIAELNWTFSNDQECVMMCGSWLSVQKASSIMDRRKVDLIPQLPKERQLFC